MRKAKSGNKMPKSVAKTGRMRSVGKRMTPASRVKQTKRAKPFGGGRGS